ncbi:COX assembly mitochondrial protein homolog [Halichondria panicea]|uniref:COX assembly mitochondrial protein homolog n=1 Tax=Halichondria panicea TaxID=6063 RepID=UPI00312B4F40
MSDSPSPSASSSMGAQGKASQSLRHVEKDVLIPKKMRAKAMVLCQDLVKEFEDCIRGRTVSAVWHCRKENSNMQNCVAKYYKNDEFYEQCKQEYLEEKKKFEETGERQNMKRASS